MSLRTGELIIIAFVIVVVLSASRMGALGNAIGRFVYSLKKAARGEDTIDVTPKRSRQKEEDAEIVEQPTRKV
ncbi:MAG: twin-arginine translocase TatA/TatE family subunit [Myxococcales bacterium]|nr:twin-arginine translocase TatA/TatE family subunit [Myxococcales bacterium]